MGTPHLEAQHFGMKILQHVARHRWRDLGQEAQQALAGDAMAGFERVAQTDVPYSIRSMTAVLVAECVRQGGPAMWEAVLQKVQAAAAVPPSNPGPAGAAVLVLHYVHDEVTGPHASLPADLKRALLSALTASLDVVLPMLLSVMESHFVEATRTGSARNEAVVCEALRCAEQVATWCPVAKMHQSRLVDAFAVLGRQGPGETRLAAVECLRQLAERRNRDEDQGPFSEAMGQVGVALMGCASPLLDSAAGQASMAPHADNEDFGKRLCDSMQLFGSAHLDCLPSRDTRMIFLQQMILFAQHSSITLSAFTLPFWLSLLRELKGDFFAAPARRAEACPDECLHALLRICFDKLAGEGRPLTLSGALLPPIHASRIMPCCRWARRVPPPSQL